MDRRGFLGAILAAAAAPAVVRASSLMRVAAIVEPTAEETITILGPALKPTNQAIIDLMQARIRAAQAMLVQQISEQLYMNRASPLEIFPAQYTWSEVHDRTVHVGLDEFLGSGN
jgi:hypothetical protein